VGKDQGNLRNDDSFVPFAESNGDPAVDALVMATVAVGGAVA
jgi:hypothetical protein